MQRDHFHVQSDELDESVRFFGRPQQRRKGEILRDTKVVCANGVSTAYEMIGAGPLLVLIHAAQADRNSFAPVIPFLSQYFTCVIYDQRDTGETINPPETYSISDLADDAATLIGALGSSAHVWGTCYGGTIAQELALRHPDRVHDLVLSVTHQCGATALSKPELFHALRLRASFDPSARKEITSLYFSALTAQKRPHLVDAVQQSLTQRPPAAQARRTAVSQAFNSEGRVSGIEARTLVLGATEDRVIDPIVSWKLASEIPNATLTMLDAIGHSLAYEDPARVAGVIADFLLCNGSADSLPTYA